MKKESVNVHIYQSPFQHESRILRITKTISDEKYFSRILIIAAYLEGQKEVEPIDSRRTIHRIKTLVNPLMGSALRFLFLIEWGIRIVLKLQKENVIVVNPHSVPALPIAWLLKIQKGSRIIYDTHELETEQYKKHSLKRYLSKIIEAVFIPSVDYMVTTSAGYAKWYQDHYGIRQIAVLKNYPNIRDNQIGEEEWILRKYTKINEKDILFIYQGIASKGRGIELLLEVFAQISPDKHIVFLGYGPLVNIIKSYSDRYRNIHFHPAVNPEDVHRFVKSCDVGFCIIENLYPSYYYSLPNKLLEALNAGVPVIVSDFPEMKKPIDEFDCGWTTKVDVDSIKHIVGSIDRTQINNKAKNALIWADRHTWEGQESTLKAVYNRILHEGKR